jgi:hypothetical protein
MKHVFLIISLALFALCGSAAAQSCPPLLFYNSTSVHGWYTAKFTTILNLIIRNAAPGGQIIPITVLSHDSYPSYVYNASVPQDSGNIFLWDDPPGWTGTTSCVGMNVSYGVQLINGTNVGMPAWNSLTIPYSVSKFMSRWAITKMANDGLMSLDDAVCTKIPFFCGTNKAAITYRQILDNSAGMDAPSTIVLYPLQQVTLAMLKASNYDHASIQNFIHNETARSWISNITFGYNTLWIGQILDEISLNLTGLNISAYINQNFVNYLPAGVEFYCGIRPWEASNPSIAPRLADIVPGVAFKQNGTVITNFIAHLGPPYVGQLDLDSYVPVPEITYNVFTGKSLVY